MADVIVIPQSNVLTFREANTDRPTLDNVLLQDDIRGWRDENPFYTCFDVLGDIAFQFITNRALSVFKLELFAYGEDIVPLCEFPLTNVFQVDTETAVLENRTVIADLAVTIGTDAKGRYYFKLTAGTHKGFPETIYYSEYIEIDDYSTSNKKLLEWSDSTNDGIWYADTDPIAFSCMAELNLDDNYIKTESVIFGGYDGSNFNLSSKNKRNVDCVCDPVPSYFADKLALAFSHKQIAINGQYFIASEGGSKKSQVKRTNLYEFSVNLIDTNFENYYRLISTGKLPVISSRRLKISDTGYLKISDTGYLKT